MKDNDIDFPDDTIGIDFTLEDEKGRDKAVPFLMGIDLENDHCKAVVLQDDRDMMIRVQYPDGRQEIFDVMIRRSIEVAVVEERN